MLRNGVGYELTPEMEQVLSKAYIQLLTNLLKAFAESRASPAG
jgi:hypothetical protein